MMPTLLRIVRQNADEAPFIEELTKWEFDISEYECVTGERRVAQDDVIGDKHDTSDVPTLVYDDRRSGNISEGEDDGGELLQDIQALRERPKDACFRFGTYGHRCVPLWQEGQRKRHEQRQMTRKESGARGQGKVTDQYPNNDYGRAKWNTSQRCYNCVESGHISRYDRLPRNSSNARHMGGRRR